MSHSDWYKEQFELDIMCKLGECEKCIDKKRCNRKKRLEKQLKKLRKVGKQGVEISE